MINKMIVVDHCMVCPLRGECKVWDKLTKKDRFYLTCGVGVGDFILEGCPLSDLPDYEKLLAVAIKLNKSVYMDDYGDLCLPHNAIEEFQEALKQYKKEI